MTLQGPCWARFKRFGDRWFAFDGKDGTSTLDAFQLVIDAPEFLGQGTSQSVPRAAMAPPQSHSNRVLVVVDEAGGIQLAVCPEPGGDSAMVVGDVVATGHRFWRKRYKALAEPFQEFLGMSLTDWISGRAGDSWSADKFRSGLERSMSEGKFPITIVVNEVDTAVKETLDYLREVNQQVRVLGYMCLTSGGDELVWPRELSEDRVVTRQQPARTQPRPSAPHPGPSAPSRPHPAVPESDPAQADPGPMAPAQPRSEEPVATGALESFDATPAQTKILRELLQLDDLGLTRRGLEYYLADDELGATPTIALSIDTDRWPFPKPEEVVVAVDTGPSHLGRFLNIDSTEAEQFLGTLPRSGEKELKGTILLRASDSHEAVQVVNELRALKEVTIGSSH
ncbi:hypothetical protein JXD38_02330 [candidate division WOR-3 bacterium]|nr:hypothetical protein [candidate division WOR-3 bacterium]